MLRPLCGNKYNHAHIIQGVGERLNVLIHISCKMAIRTSASNSLGFISQIFVIYNASLTALEYVCSDRTYSVSVHTTTSFKTQHDNDICLLLLRQTHLGGKRHSFSRKNAYKCAYNIQFIISSKAVNYTLSKGLKIIRLTAS